MTERRRKPGPKRRKIARTISLRLGVGEARDLSLIQEGFAVHDYRGEDRQLMASEAIRLAIAKLAAQLKGRK